MVLQHIKLILKTYDLVGNYPLRFFLIKREPYHACDLLLDACMHMCVWCACVVYACSDVCGVHVHLCVGLSWHCVCFSIAFYFFNEAGPFAQPGAHWFQLVYSLAPDSATLWPKCWEYTWLPLCPAFMWVLGLHGYPPGYLPRLCNNHFV